MLREGVPFNSNKEWVIFEFLIPSCFLTAQSLGVVAHLVRVQGKWYIQ